MNVIDTLEEWWNGLISLSEVFIIPDWGNLVALLPLLLLIGVVGPILTILVLFWFRYRVVKPTVKTAFADSRRTAELDAGGNPVFPLGEPYSPTEAVIYEPGTTRSPAGEALVVACPKCSLVRPAVEATCGNCGLSFTLQPTTRSLRPAGPPPGGRASA